VPAAAVEPAWMVSVLEPSPGAASEDGANEALTPEGRPVTDKEMAELNAPACAAVRVTCPAAPCSTVILVGATLTVKLPILSVMGAVDVTPPPVALTVMV